MLTILCWLCNEHPTVNNSYICIGSTGSVGFQIFYLLYYFKTRNNQSKDNMYAAEAKHLESTTFISRLFSDEFQI